MKLPESRTLVKPPTVSDAGKCYHAAERRLLAAQQEKMEAMSEFLAVREILKKRRLGQREAFGDNSYP